MAASGYRSVRNNAIIMGPTERILEAGDVPIIDTETTCDGCFCNFDCNFAFGRPSEEARRVQEVVYRAAELLSRRAAPEMPVIS